MGSLIEKEEIRRDGGKPQKNSGRGKIQKADAVLEPYCYDVKEYEKSFSISRSVWAKICDDAFRSGRREPAIKAVLGGKDSKIRLWIIEDKMFHEMRKAWLEKYGE